MIDVFQQAHLAALLMAFAVAGGREEIKGGIQADAASQIGEKDRRSLQHTNQDNFLSNEIPRDLFPHLGDALGDLISRVENFQSSVNSGSGHKRIVHRAKR